MITTCMVVLYRLAYFVKGRDCRTRWGTLVRSDMGPWVAEEHPPRPLFFAYFQQMSQNSLYFELTYFTPTNII